MQKRKLGSINIHIFFLILVSFGVNAFESDFENPEISGDPLTEINDFENPEISGDPLTEINDFENLEIYVESKKGNEPPDVFGNLFSGFGGLFDGSSNGFDNLKFSLYLGMGKNTDSDKASDDTSVTILTNNSWQTFGLNIGTNYPSIPYIDLAELSVFVMKYTHEIERFDRTNSDAYGIGLMLYHEWRANNSYGVGINYIKNPSKIIITSDHSTENSVTLYRKDSLDLVASYLYKVNKISLSASYSLDIEQFDSGRLSINVGYDL